MGKVWMGEKWMGKVWMGKVWMGKVWMGKVMNPGLTSLPFSVLVLIVAMETMINHDKFRECGHQTCMKDLRVVTF